MQTTNMLIQCPPVYIYVNKVHAETSQQNSRSRLIYCNEKIATKYKEMHPEFYEKRVLPLKKVIGEMRGFRDILYSMRSINFADPIHISE